MRQHSDLDKHQRINTTAGLMIVVIYLLLIVFGIVSLASPDWLKDLSHVGQRSEAIAMKNYGDNFLNQGAYPMAIAQYDKAIRIYSRLAEAYINRGIAYMLNKDFDLAVKSFEEALVFEDFLQDATYFNLAKIHSERNDPKSAIQYYLKSAEVSPFPLMPYQNAGELLNNAGQWDQAFAVFTKALENTYTMKNCYRGMLIRDYYLFTDSATRQDIRRLRAMDLEQVDLSSYDTKAFDDALLRDGLLAGVYNQFGYTHAMTGNYQAAVNYFEKALNIRPDFQNARNNLNTAISRLQKQGTP